MKEEEEEGRQEGGWIKGCSPSWQSHFCPAELQRPYRSWKIRWNLPRLLRDSVIQRLGTHHAAVELLGVRVCPHPLLHLAVCAALAVEVGRWVTRDRQVGVKSVSGQRAVEEVLVRAQVVALGGGGASQAEILVVGASSATDPLDCLLSSQLSDLNTEEQGSYQRPRLFF